MRSSCVTIDDASRVREDLVLDELDRIFRPVSPSSDAVGSSKINTSGSLTMARAMATRCCSPPLSLTGGRCTRSLRPTISRYRTASAIASSQARRCRMSGIATFSAVVSRGNR